MLIKKRPNEKLLVKSRKQYIKLSEAFYNIVGIPPKSFIEFLINWELVEKEQLYQSIISDDLDDHLYCEEKTGIVLNKRQSTGKETPRKIRKNSLSKYKKKNIKKDNKKNNDDNNENIDIINEKEKENIVKFNKTILKIKKQREISLNSYNDYESNLYYFKNMVRKLIFNRFINNLFIDFTGEKDEDKQFKIYAISPRIRNNSEKEKEDTKNIEVILLNPILIV